MASSRFSSVLRAWKIAQEAIHSFPSPLTQIHYWDWKCHQATPLPLRGWQHQGREFPPGSLADFFICFHFVTRRFYLSSLEGCLNNIPTGLKESPEADSKYAFVLSHEHHPHVKTSSHTVREMGVNSVCNFLHPLYHLSHWWKLSCLWIPGASLQMSSDS